MDLWQQGLLTLLVATVPATIVWLLGRKGANKKLDLEEGALENATFVVQRDAFASLFDRYKVALEEANEEIKKAHEELVKAKETREGLEQTVAEQGDEILKLQGLRTLLIEIVRNHNIELSEDQQFQLEATKPVARRTRRMA